MSTLLRLTGTACGLSLPPSRLSLETTSVSLLARSRKQELGLHVRWDAATRVLKQTCGTDREITILSPPYSDGPGYSPGIPGAQPFLAMFTLDYGGFFVHSTILLRN